MVALLVIGRRTRSWAPAAAVSAALLVAAFSAAPRSCEGGLEAYALAGLAGVAVMLAAPWWTRRHRSVGARLLHALAGAALAVAVWVLGMAWADVRIMCRLF